MITRTLALLAIVAIAGSNILGQETDVTIDVGDLLFIRMTGELAKEYTRRTDTPKSNAERDGLEIHSTATISQKIDERHYRIEHSSRISFDSMPDRMITLTGIVESNKIETHIVPKNTQVYSSPADEKNGIKPTLTQNDQKTYRLKLSGLKGLKLQMWELKEEIGD